MGSGEVSIDCPHAHAVEGVVPVPDQRSTPRLARYPEWVVRGVGCFWKMTSMMMAVVEGVGLGRRLKGPVEGNGTGGLGGWHRQSGYRPKKIRELIHTNKVWKLFVCTLYV